LSPSLAELLLHKLDAGVEASGPHDFAVRVSAFVSALAASTASRPAFRDDRDTPLMRDETARDIDLIWVRREWKYFCKQDWTASTRLIRFNKSS
jgi:hypothetical protein